MTSSRALAFDATPAHFVMTRALRGLTESAVYGGLSGLRSTQIEDLALPGPDWARLEVIAAGICGTDLSTIAFDTSTALEPLASFPAVLGHEILARVVEVGAKVEGFSAGDRVAVDPCISCAVRGVPRDHYCPSCRVGRTGTCERAGESGPLLVDGRPLAPGRTIGFHRDLPGGWGHRLLAHRSQLHRVESALTDHEAVLLEPLSIGVHAALGIIEQLGENVLVIGSGAIALGMIWALRALGFKGKITAQTKRTLEGDLARTFGADALVRPGDEARTALLGLGARAYRPTIGPEIFVGGFDTVIDCVGRAESLSQALRFARARGLVVVLGCAAVLPRLDLSFLWADELTVRGFVTYGRERFEGESLHTFEVTQRLLARTRPPIERLITGIHPLSGYKKALAALHDRKNSGAIKMVLRP